MCAYTCTERDLVDFYCTCNYVFLFLSFGRQHLMDIAPFCPPAVMANKYSLSL